MQLTIERTNAPSHELLLLADESEASVADYIGRGACYAARCGDTLAGQYVLLHTRPFTAEVVNIAVVPRFQRQGIGTALLAHAVRTAREAGFRRLEIGTGVRVRGRSPSTCAAGSYAAASTRTTSANTIPPQSSKTASNAAT